MKVTIIDRFDDGKHQEVIVRSLEIDNHLFLQIYEMFKELKFNLDRFPDHARTLTEANSCSGELPRASGEGLEGSKWLKK